MSRDFNSHILVLYLLPFHFFNGSPHHWISVHVPRLNLGKPLRTLSLYKLYRPSPPRPQTEVAIFRPPPLIKSPSISLHYPSPPFLSSKNMPKGKKKEIEKD